MSKMVFRSKIEQAIPELEPFKGPMQGLYIFKNLAKIENVESLHRLKIWLCSFRLGANDVESLHGADLELIPNA